MMDVTGSHQVKLSYYYLHIQYLTFIQIQHFIARCMELPNFEVCNGDRWYYDFKYKVCRVGSCDESQNSFVTSHKCQYICSRNNRNCLLG